MQIKYILTTLMGLAAANALANPVAQPGALNPRAEQAEQGEQANQVQQAGQGGDWDDDDHFDDFDRYNGGGYRGGGRGYRGGDRWDDRKGRGRGGPWYRPNRWDGRWD
ncbi:hypothetical protein M409DRAFT_60028 [Zasmidium cellare ATCC 36951]|uniref:Uncharacterized protein n=1 Tax=Zasmidium cellare ATCC 36951 TaxID=1080233 RepID=A0A6A6C4L9_ZASCE|nr:uncharacterized protein M409DRAFT_60028 [Zasmidium cellare ATCC 36951]KAF2160326.1 hypothetical protein M409DRAFT_60028 [Zasmidium cellare ATCC 36951]